MSFLQPILLVGLPLALLPIVIHLINQQRHRTVKWAAMMFLLDAKKMTRGMARLRQILILTMRVLAVVTLLFAASRPLAGGWLALTGGKADTVLVLLDRSSSMEQQNLETGRSKRITALSKLSDLLEKTGRGSEIVLIDSATLEPTPVANISALADLPQSSATATAADIPTLLERALDYLAREETGRADIWLASDLRRSDWNPGSGQWQRIRAELGSMETVRLFLLTYPRIEGDNLAVSASRVERRRTPEGYELVMDLSIRRQGLEDLAPRGLALGDPAEEITVPVEFTLNGTRTVEEMTITGDELIRLGHVVPLGDGNETGWGRIDLPADDNPADNSAFLVFDEPATRLTVIVSDDSSTSASIRAASASAVEGGIPYDAKVITPENVAQVPWDETALLFWQAALPEPDSTVAALLRQHVESGKTLVLLSPDTTGDSELFGFRWGEITEREADQSKVGWWRIESGLLANTRSGDPLPVDDLGVFKFRTFDGEFQPLLRLDSEETVIAKLVSETAGSIYAWGILPRSDSSTLASDGVAFFVMIHRALEEGVNAISRAQFRETAPGALPENSGQELLSSLSAEDSLTTPELLPSAYRIRDVEGQGRLVALNRPRSEDDYRVLAPDSLEGLLEGVEFRRIADEVDSGSSLAAEIWRTFLILMGLALLAEALLCLPPRPEPDDKETAMSKP